VCYELNIPVIVAPYEADAQLTYLVNKNIVDVIVTEDSDLMVFGCQRVLFKLDDNGDGVEIRLADIGKTAEEPRMDGWSQEKFRQMCVMAGCDYLERIPGMGLKTVHKQFRKYANVERGIKSFIAEKKMKSTTSNIDPNYYENFLQAVLAFKHHLVFDPVTQTMVPLNPLPPHSTLQEMAFLGKVLSDREVTEIACGNTNPNNGKKVASFSPNYSTLATRCDEWRKSKGTQDRFSESNNDSNNSNVQSVVSGGAMSFSTPVLETPVPKQLQKEPRKFFSSKRGNECTLEKVQLNGDDALAKIYGTGKRRKVIPQTSPQQSRFFATPQSAQSSSNPFAVKKPLPQDFSPEKENSPERSFESSSPERIKFPIHTGPDKSASTFKSVMKPSNVKYSSAIKYDQFINLDDEKEEKKSYREPDKAVLKKIPTPENHYSVKVNRAAALPFRPPVKTESDSSQSKKMAVSSKPSPWINTASLSKKKVVNLSKPGVKSQPTLKNFMKSSQSSNDDKTKSKYF